MFFRLVDVFHQTLVRMGVMEHPHRTPLAYVVIGARFRTTPAPWYDTRPSGFALPFNDDDYIWVFVFQWQADRQIGSCDLNTVILSVWRRTERGWMRDDQASNAFADQWV